MLELIYVEKIIKFYLDLIAGSKGLTCNRGSVLFGHFVSRDWQVKGNRPLLSQLLMGVTTKKIRCLTDVERRI